MTAGNASRLWATACHEAGHAVIGHILERNVRKVTIIPRDGYLGHALSYGHVGTNYWTKRRQMETAILSLYGGVFAEKELTGRRHNWTGATFDLDKIVDIALSEEGESADAYLRWARSKARRMVQIHRLQIEAVATALMEAGTLDREAFLAALWSSIPLPDIPGVTIDLDISRTAGARTAAVGAMSLI